MPQADWLEPRNAVCRPIFGLERLPRLTGDAHACNLFDTRVGPYVDTRLPRLLQDKATKTFPRRSAPSKHSVPFGILVKSLMEPDRWELPNPAGCFW